MWALGGRDAGAAAGIRVRPTRLAIPVFLQVEDTPGILLLPPAGIGRFSTADPGPSPTLRDIEQGIHVQGSTCPEWSRPLREYSLQE